MLHTTHKVLKLSLQLQCALAYTGIEGLSVSYGVGSNDGSAGTASNADVTTMKASYAYGPVTVAILNH
jgi:outer membrane protein OmpU